MLGLASALLLFASILVHELGHPVVARRRGVKIEATDLWLLGGVAQMSGQPNTAETSCASRSPAPAVTAVVAGVFGALELAGRAGLNAQQRTRARHTTIADAIPAEADEVGATRSSSVRAD